MKRIKNHLSTAPSQCEERVMLAAGETSGPSEGEFISRSDFIFLDPVAVAVTGSIRVFIEGDRTVAIVPTQDTPRPEGTLSGITEVEREIAVVERESPTLNVRATRTSESDNGVEVTQDEIDAVANALYRDAGEVINAGVYVGETGSGTLSRVNSGILPTVRTQGESADILELGFDEQAGGNAQSLEDLPDILTLSEPVTRSFDRLRNFTRRNQQYGGVLLNANGRVNADVGVTDFDDLARSSAFFGVFDELEDSGRISARSGPSFIVEEAEGPVRRNRLFISSAEQQPGRSVFL